VGGRRDKHPPDPYNYQSARRSDTGLSNGKAAPQITTGWGGADPSSSALPRPRLADAVEVLLDGERLWVELPTPTGQGPPSTWFSGPG